MHVLGATSHRDEGQKENVTGLLKCSPASCQKCESKTHFLINVFISFVHDKRSKGDKWVGLGSRGF